MLVCMWVSDALELDLHSSELTSVCWEFNLGPLDRQLVLSTANHLSRMQKSLIKEENMG